MTNREIDKPYTGNAVKTAVRIPARWSRFKPLNSSSRMDLQEIVPAA
jgi:hypothetical protein